MTLFVRLRRIHKNYFTVTRRRKRKSVMYVWGRFKTGPCFLRYFYAR